MASVSPSSPQSSLTGLRVVFVGRLAGMSKREAQQLVRARGGVPLEGSPSDDCLAGADLLVLAEQSPPLVLAEILGPAARSAFDEGRLVTLNETQFWQRLGLIDEDAHVSRMYTPAMLAELLGVPVATVRRWHRGGLLVASRRVGQLPYFDFSQVATARQLATLQSAGASQRQMEKQFAALARWFPDAAGSSPGSALVVEGKRLLVRQGDGLVEAGGQQRFDFAANPATTAVGAAEPQATVPLESATPLAGPADLVESAQALEENGQLDAAAEMYRAALAAGGPLPETCFALAELLYRMGDLAAARERYYMAIELDENFVEARANLGCVLAECGQSELAVSAFEGALVFHDEFPDAHYHLARVLDELGRAAQADDHWRRFLELAPDSPWADAARERLAP